MAAHEEQRRCDDCKSHENYVGRIMKLEQQFNTHLSDSSQVLIHIEYLRKEVGEIRNDIDNKFVTSDEFMPVRMIAYGVVALVGTGIIGALITLIVRTPKL